VLSRFDQKNYQRMSLTQNGTDLTGKGRGVTLTGTIHGDKLECEAKPGDQTVRVTATFDGREIHGIARSSDGEQELLAYREAPHAAPQTRTFEPEHFYRFFSGAIAPVLHINPGDTVKTWTVDAGGFDANGKRRSNGGNPETGPFYIDGALPGDALAITLKRVHLNRDSAISDGSVAANALDAYYFADLEKVKDFNADWTLDRERGVAHLKQPTAKLKDYTIPLRPMMGCIGVAPGGDMVYRSGFLGGFGGNMDYNEMREGVTLYLPVFQPGALLFIGDGHAAQGDGELTGDALETSMDVEFTVNLIPGGAQGQSFPRLENDEYIMAMGIAGSLNDALKGATTGLSRWLARDYGLNPAEIAAVLGTSMRYDIAEVVDPYVNVVAKVKKQALKPIPKQTPAH